MGKSVLDYFIATKIISAQVDEQPYSYDLNKKLPSTITKDSLMPENVAKLPEVPPEIKPLGNDFLGKIKRLQEIEKELKVEQEKFQKSVAGQTQERNNLKLELNAMAQELGPAIQKIDSEIDTVIATLNDFFIAAQKRTKSVETTLTPEAQMEMMKNIMLQVNKEFSEEVLGHFDTAIQKYRVVNTTIEKTLRLWPIPQSKMGMQEIKVLIAQVETDIKALVFDLHDMIMGGLSALVSMNTTIQDGIKQLSNNVSQMPTQEPMGLAAMRKLWNNKKV